MCYSVVRSNHFIFIKRGISLLIQLLAKKSTSKMFNYSLKMHNLSSHPCGFPSSPGQSSCNINCSNVCKTFNLMNMEDFHGFYCYCHVIYRRVFRKLSCHWAATIVNDGMWLSTFTEVMFLDTIFMNYFTEVLLLYFHSTTILKQIY